MEYTVGIVCALALELLAVRALFDVTHTNSNGIISHEDSNHYALGEIEKHRVVAACLPEGEYGTNSAADVAANLRRTFPGVKFALLIGIGGGVPSPANDIRLVDVIVSRPAGSTTGGQLFNSDYVHDSRHATCDSWDVSQASMRAGRPNSHPHIHYDTIASGNRVVRNAKLRDRWSQESNVLCFEMEAAGIMNTLPCLVIRGICD
ncbi:nucleoside phosphorylase domain-containing protein [Aspergillus alliaceus]|uniref:Nucleoside phosphorylase domain-containing protein n=1 Tax=Petromyces alliaceus TaxID=209559 RepID=A0A5N7BT15_PETAA|nr:nucleoside phosphorylase domain-containing protein [Aspergillus alliaceus]